MPPSSKTIDLKTEAATIDFAQSIARLLEPGDVILLEGPIGAGKTFFARGVIQTLLSEPEDVPSPTFTLVQVYDGPLCEIWHCDLYRLTHPDEAIELGLEDAFDDAICLIEWPDRLGEVCPKRALTITLSVSEDHHQASISADPSWQQRLLRIDV